MRGWKAGVNTVDAVVEALCLDFPRRADAIAKKNVTHRTEMEYRYLNYKILTAVKEIVREDWAETMIEDIGARTGYAKTELSDTSEKDYKIKKRMVKDNIARALHLTD